MSDIKTNIGLAVDLAYNLSLVGNPKVVKLEDILSKLGLDKINTPAPTTQSGPSRIIVIFKIYQLFYFLLDL